MSLRCWLGIGFLSLVILSGCSRARDPFAGAGASQLKVLASFPPLYCFAANVANEHAKVLCFLTTQGPHGFQALPTDSIKVAKCDVFFTNGLELDEFVTKLAAEAHRKSVVCEVGEELPDEKLIHLGKGERQHVHADGTVHPEGEHDPHVWLGPERAALMVDVIAKRLAELKPEAKADFDKHAA